MFENPVPINALSLSASKVTDHLIARTGAEAEVLTKIICPLISVFGSQGQVYAGSEIGAVQVPVCTCGRYATCVDCILSRDPYCGWDPAVERCVAVRGSSGSVVQSLKEGDLSQCPDPGMLLPFTVGEGGEDPRHYLIAVQWEQPCVCVCVFIFRPDVGGGRCPHSGKQHPAAVPGPLQFGTGPVAVF